MKTVAKYDLEKENWPKPDTPRQHSAKLRDDARFFQRFVDHRHIGEYVRPLIAELLSASRGMRQPDVDKLPKPMPKRWEAYSYEVQERLCVRTSGGMSDEEAEKLELT